MGKLIIMGVTPPGLNGGNVPITPDQLRLAASSIEDVRALTRIAQLESAVKELSDKIESLTTWTANLSRTENFVDKIADDLNKLGGRLNSELAAVESRQTTNVNELGKRLELRIGELQRFRDRADGIGIALGTLIASGVILWALNHFAPRISG